MLEKGKNIANVIKEQLGNNVLVYGYGFIGKMLVDRLLLHKIVVEAVFDKAILRRVTINGVMMCRLEDLADYESPMIVTVTYWFDEIKHTLRELGYQGTIVSLEQIIEQAKKGY